jgi:hypothetical protein
MNDVGGGVFPKYVVLNNADGVRWH